MAILDVLRFRGIMMRGGFPEAPAEEFVTGLDEALEEQLSPLAAKADVRQVVDQAKREIIDRLEKAMLAQEARQARQMLTWVGVILGAIAIATGIIIAVVTLT